MCGKISYEQVLTLPKSAKVIDYIPVRMSIMFYHSGVSYVNV